MIESESLEMLRRLLIPSIVLIDSSSTCGDLALDRLGRRARERRGDHHHRELDARPEIDAEPGNRDDAQHDQGADQHHGEDGAPDRGVGDLHDAGLPGAATTRTGMPGAISRAAVPTITVAVRFEPRQHLGVVLGDDAEPARRWPRARPSRTTSTRVPPSSLRTAARGTSIDVALRPGHDVDAREDPRLERVIRIGNEHLHAVGARLRIDRVAHRAHRGLDRLRQALDVDERGIAHLHDRELALGDVRLGLELGRLLEHDHDRLGLHERRGALVDQTLRDRAAEGRDDQRLLQVVAREGDALGGLPLVRLRDGDLRAQAFELLGRDDVAAAQRVAAREVGLDLRALGARDVQHRRGLAQRHLVGSAVDLEERSAGLDAVAVVHEDLLDASADLRADPALATGPQAAGGGDPLEDRAAPHAGRGHLDDRLGGSELRLARGRRGHRAGSGAPCGLQPSQVIANEHRYE